MPSLPMSRTRRTPLAVATSVVQEAGALLLDRFLKAKDVTEKSRGNVVTNVDKDSEALIIDRLLDEFPGFGLLAEESGGRGSGSEFSWVIDPLDGTKNYASGVPLYCVTIALARGAEVLVGATYDPPRGELYQAVKGEGAFLNGARLKVSERNSLAASLVGTDMGYRDDLGHYALQMWDAVWPVQGIRIMGSSALGLAYAAAGRVDIFVHHYLYPWDVAAGVLMVREAGGLVSDRTGKPHDFLKDPSIIAANPAVHGDFLRRTEGLAWRNPPSAGQDPG